MRPSRKGRTHAAGNRRSGEDMVSGKVKVMASMGLHLRPAGTLCKQATQYQCKIELVTERSRANAKSVLSVLGACVKSGEEIELVCDGPDEQQALDELTDLINHRLEEERLC